MYIHHKHIHIQNLVDQSDILNTIKLKKSIGKQKVFSLPLNTVDVGEHLIQSDKVFQQPGPQKPKAHIGGGQRATMEQGHLGLYRQGAKFCSEFWN